MEHSPEPRDSDEAAMSCGRTGRSGSINMTSFIMSETSGSQMSVITTLKQVCALAICRAMISTPSPAGRNGRHDCREGASQTDEEQTAGQVEDAVCQGDALGIPRLPDGGEKRRDGRPQIVPEQDGDGALETEDARSVGTWLRGEVLQHGDGRARALHDERHHRAHEDAENGHAPRPGRSSP